MCRPQFPALSVAEGGDLQTGDIRAEHLVKNNIEFAHDAILEAAVEAKRCGVILRTRFPSLTRHAYGDIPFHAGGIQPKNCLNLYTTFWILPDLEVIGCSHVSTSVGNLGDTDFAELWNSTDHWYAQARRSFREKTVPDACSECGYSGSFLS